MSQPKFLQQLANPLTGEDLFDQLPNVVYFIKDARGAYVVVNSTLVERSGVRSKDDVLGRTAVELLGSPLGEQFTTQDQQVLATGKPLIAQLELHTHRSGFMGWCLTTKLPLRSKRGTIVGLQGVSQDLRLPNVDSREYDQMAQAIRTAEENLGTKMKTPELAELAGLSVYQLDRRMKIVFGLTSGQWLMKLRIDRAQRLLTETDQAIAEVALDVGYCDQSAFSRQFRLSTGFTPKQFRSANRAAISD